MENKIDDPMTEIQAISAVAQALAGLDEQAVKRVIRWAADKFGASDASDRGKRLEQPIDEDQGEDEATDVPEWGDVAELYAAASPTSDSERALVVGYWLQYCEEMQEFDSQKLNTLLKNLGHGVSNITGALSGLKSRKPQLVIQTKKSGTSRQARKKYKVTEAGRLAVEGMLKRTD